MENKKLVIIGAGGLGKEVLWLLEENNKKKQEWDILGFLDENLELTTPIYGYPILGNDKWLMEYWDSIYVVCAIARPDVRKKVISRFKKYPNIKFPSIISCSAQVGMGNSFGEGVILCCNCVVTVECRIGDFSIINPGSFLGHEVFLEEYVTLYPQVSVCGNVRIGEGTQIGVGSQVIQQKVIGKDTIIGAGSIVIRDIPDHCTAVGNPCRVLEKN